MTTSVTRKQRNTKQRRQRHPQRRRPQRQRRQPLRLRRLQVDRLRRNPAVVVLKSILHWTDRRAVSAKLILNRLLHYQQPLLQRHLLRLVRAFPANLTNITRPQNKLYNNNITNDYSVCALFA